MTRRGKHEGTYCKKADGRHCFKLRYDGERHEFYGRTKAEARAKMREAVNRLEAGMPAVDAKVALRDWLEEWRGTQLAARGLKPSTRNAYATLCKLHIEADPVGKVTLDKLKPSHIDALIVRLNDKELAKSSVRQVYHVLRLALADAVRDDLLARNPAERVKRPQTDEKEARYLSPAEVRQVLDAARSSRYYAVLALIAATGLRRGEALALKWSDVDLVDGVLRVRGTLARVDGKLTVTKPKTKKSRRELEIPASVVDLLARHKDAQEGDAERACNLWENSGFVFTTEFGKPVDPRNVFRVMQAAAKKAKIKGVGLHTLRHSWATALMDEGENIKVVSALLGHSSVAITGDVYVHATDGGRRAAMSSAASLMLEVEE